MSEIDYETKREEITAKYREDLLSGRTLVLSEASHRSRYGYEPPCNRGQYAHAIKTLGDMAARSDRLTQIASAIVGKINPYGTPSQLCASIYGAAFQATNTKYDDVINRASPEPGRWSDNQHDWTIHDRVALAYWLEFEVRRDWAQPGDRQ